MRVLAYFVVAFAAACAPVASSPDASSPDPALPDAAETPDGAAPSIGGDRPVKIVVPSTYDGKTPLPLVVVLHGYGASSAIQELYFQLAPVAEARGFLYAVPDGTPDATNKKFWNATDACCNFGKVPVDDSAYLAKVVEQIQAAYAVDPKRIFFFGHSNGGFMAYRMACEHADKVAAIVSLAGAMVNDAAKCNPSEPVSVLQIHGDADQTVSYGGGAFYGATYPSAATTIAGWVSRDGCSPTVDLTSPPVDLEPTIPGAETLIRRYVGCKAKTGVELWTVQGGAHIPSLNAEFRTRTIDFLLSHAKP